MKIVFATGNANKLKEIKEIMGDISEEILSMKEAGVDPEIVEDGITGLLCKLGNVQELASHMRTLMTDRETLLRFSANGRERAFRCFSVDQNVQQIYKTYESVLASE